MPYLFNTIQVLLWEQFQQFPCEVFQLPHWHGAYIPVLFSLWENMMMWSLLEEGSVMILVPKVSDWRSLISCLYTDFSQNLVFYSTSAHILFIPVANNN